LSTGWGQYPQGAYYPPPVQKPQELREEIVEPVTTTTTTTTQYVEVLPATTTVPLTTTTIPVTTTTVPIMTTGIMGQSVIGPNTHGVPENFPWLAADAGCHKCHGTGYKKKLITRRWAPCKKCARKYGTDIHRVDLKNLPPLHPHEYETMPVTSTYVTGASTMPMTTTYVTGASTLPVTTTMVGTTVAGTMPGTTYMAGTLPAGF
jgi:hypothetical protein